MSNRLILLSIILFSVTGCQAFSSAKKPPVANSLQIGTKPFQFSPEEVSELTLAKSDPETGDRWLSVLRHTQTNWEILSEPQDQPILDKFADEVFISHLIDALRSIQIASFAPLGPLESFELNPPRFGIKWKTSKKDFEFRLGAKLRDGSGYYFTLDGNQVLVARGSSLKMFDMIHTFQFVRRRTWTTLSPDSVDEIELEHRGKLFLYAQREGDRWTDKKHKAIKHDIDSLLNNALLAQAAAFVDDPQQASQLKAFLQKQPLYEARLSDRRGHVTFLKIKLKDKNVYGLNSSRPLAIFQLEPNFLKELESIPR